MPRDLSQTSLDENDRSGEFDLVRFNECCDACGQEDTCVEMGPVKICEGCAWYAYCTIVNYYADEVENEE